MLPFKFIFVLSNSTFESTHSEVRVQDLVPNRIRHPLILVQPSQFLFLSFRFEIRRSTSFLSFQLLPHDLSSIPTLTTSNELEETTTSTAGHAHKSLTIIK